MKHQEDYENLRVALRNFFSWDQGEGDPLVAFSSVRALLKEREEREAEDALLKKRDDEEEGKEEHKQKMMETGAKEEENVEESLDYLLDVAIERFGYSARFVFRAIFDFDSTTELFQDAFNISFQQLKDTVTSLANNSAINFQLCNRIVAISPVYPALNPLGRVRWKVAFNSDWVATEIMKKLNAAENIEVRQVIHFFRGIPQAGSMVGSLFEPLAHTLIPGTSGGSWPLIRMVSNKTTLSNETSSKELPPKFVVPAEASPDNEVKLDQGTREIINFKYVSKLSALDDKKYYIPDAINFALSDSFMVDIDYPRRLATLWIFQVTKSQLHRGSAKGYLYVRTLISILKNQLKEKQPPSKTAKVTSEQTPSKPVVNVRYVLVVPKGEPGNWEWQFPAGWDEACKINDHRGDVYCLDLSLAVPSVRSIIMKNILSFECIASRYSRAHRYGTFLSYARMDNFFPFFFLFSIVSYVCRLF